MTNLSDNLASSVDTSLAARRERRLAAAFARAERDGLRLAVRVRFAVLAVIALWLILHQERDPPLIYGLAILALFALSAFVYMRLNKRMARRRWLDYGFVALDTVLLTTAIIALNQLAESPLPKPMELHSQGFLYFFVLLALVALSYAPGLVLWCGLVSTMSWGAAVAWVTLDPRADTGFRLFAAPHMSEQRIAAYLDPWSVDLLAQLHRILLLLVVTGALAIIVHRARGLVFRQAVAERARANLARHFSPTMVDELAERDEPLGATRRQDVAVLFADMIGFTGLSAAAAPERVIELLREFHRRLEACVFAYRGTVDKYMGDGVMVTFGTPRPAADDAARAIACARAMLDSIDAWNAERRRAGEPPIRVGIGAHYGPVVLGDIGSERRLEFAAIGDTINVASRIEELTRALRCALLVSDELLQRGALAEDDRAAFADMGAHVLRGRTGVVRLWACRHGPLAAVSAATKPG